MPYSPTTDDDDVIGTVDHSGGSFFLIEPDRYGFELADWRKEENKFWSPEPKYDANGKEQRPRYRTLAREAA